MNTSLHPIIGDAYAELNSKRKRVEILDYFFRKYNELNAFTYLKPKDFKKEYEISINQQRTLNRNFQWLWYRYITIGNTENNKQEDVSLTTEYKIRTEDERGIIFKYKIPTDPVKRKHYATLLISLLHDSTDIASEIPFFKETVEMSMGFITKISDGIFRDVLLASKIYKYFKYNKGNLLSIVAELSYFQQPIWICFKDGTEIKNGVIHSIGIYEDGVIELSINKMIIKIETIDEIVDIFVLSKNCPSSKVAKIGNVNINIFLDSLKNQTEYDRMVEIYNQNCINKDIPNDSFEEFIRRLCRKNKDNLNIVDRANRKIRIIE